MIKHYFGWGDTRGLRKVLMECYSPLEFHAATNWVDCGYPEPNGMPELIKNVHKLIKRMYGKTYKHLYITGGATQSVGASMYAMGSHFETVATQPLYFPYYPDMIKLAGMTHIVPKDIGAPKAHNSLVLLDLPNNPTGIVLNKLETDPNKIILDAVYATPTYGMSDLALQNKLPPHATLCGSLNKLTGLNGLRVGFIATNDFFLSEQIKFYITNTSCATSYPGQMVANKILSDNESLEMFFKKSRRLIDNNRGEFERLSKIFGGQDVAKIGMFAYFQTDKKINGLLNKAGVEFMDGIKCGSPTMAVRLNMANTNEATKLMVDEVLKKDRK